MPKKTVIVTGAVQGIGKGIALRFAQGGYNVVVADRNLAQSEAVAQDIAAATGAETLGIAADVTDAAAVAALFQKTIERFGGLHTLVNNAGIYPFKPFAEMTADDWSAVMDVNLKGVFLATQEATKVLPEGGSIVNISSIASLIGFENLVHYCASKGGVNGFTRALALELAPRNIRINAVAPGAIDTPGAFEKASDEVKQKTAASVPLGRIGSPADIAHATFFLASDEASYITGQVLVVDGGWTVR
jgi:3-oxoacyl-[acyl-carrier protein] reductase